MQRELLDMRRRVLGPEHPDTLNTMGNLAASLSGQGKHAEAEQMQRELLNVQRRDTCAGCFDRSIQAH